MKASATPPKKLQTDEGTTPSRRGSRRSNVKVDRPIGETGARITGAAGSQDTPP